MASRIASKSLPLVVAFASVLILKGIYATEDLDFTQEPSDAVVLRNRPLTLGCAVTGLPPLTVQWLYNGQAISPNADRQVLSNGSLFLPNVLPKRDSGEYQCCVSNELGRICSSPASVTVSNVPRYTVVQLPDTIQRGGVLRLECSSEGAIPVTEAIWRLGKVVILPDQRRTILPSGVLQVSDVVASDAGNYRCLTQNVANRRIKSPAFSVLVQEPPDSPSRDPVIVAGPQAQWVLEGEMALFECFANGDSLRVTWTREDGRPIRTQDVNYLGRSNLQLLEVTASDEAVYVCTAENTVTGATVQARAQLYHVVPPAFRVAPSKFFGPLGSTGRFSCSATGRPTPAIHWLHNGQPVELDERVVQQPSDDLVFIGVQREDMGMVQCVAENEGGRIQAGAQLEVRLSGKLPNPPQHVRLHSINPNTVMVTWSPPERSEIEIIAYSIHYQAVESKGSRELDEICNAEDTQFMVDELNPHTNYSFYMLSWNTNGPSKESARQYIFTEQSRPSMPPKFTAASNTPTSITLNWQPVPPQHRHGIITRYRITVREHSGGGPADTLVNNASVTAFTLEGLLAGTIYQVRMAAATNSGFGVNSDWLTVQTRVEGDLRPNAPYFETVTLNYSSISVLPDPPQPSDLNLLGLKLFYSKLDLEEEAGDDDPILLSLNTTEYIITGLEPDTAYIIRLLVYTIAEDGEGTVQEVRTASMPGIPNQFLEAPTNLAVQALSSRSVRLTWHAPVTNQLVNGYVVRYWPRGNRSRLELPIQLDLEKNNTINQVIIQGLDPFTMYEFDVCSVSTKMSGPFCDARAVRTLEDRPSTPPEDILAKPLAPHAVELQWQPPMQPNGIITHYVILYDEDVNKPEDKWNQQARNGTAHHSTVNGLASDTKYYFKVRAGTQVGEGPPTDAVAAQTLTAAQPGVNTSRWQESLVIGVCSAFVLIATIVFFIICKRRGLLKRAQSSAAAHIHSSNGAVCTGYVARASPDGQTYVTGVADSGQQNGFIPMRAVLPQPQNMDTKGGTPLIINGNGPVRTYHHHHHHCPNGGMAMPSRFPRPPGPCSADPDASSMALLPGSESVTNSDLGEDNSQGKSEASSSSGGFSSYSQDPNHRTMAMQQCCLASKLPQCSSCCIVPCPQLSDSSTGSYGEPVMGSRVARVLPSSPSPPRQQSAPQSQGLHATRHTGVDISGSGQGSWQADWCFSDGRWPAPTPAPTLQRNELTWPRHTGRVPCRVQRGENVVTSTSDCAVPQPSSSVWQRQSQAPSDMEVPCQQNAEALPSPDSADALGGHQQTPETTVQGEDTSPDFLNRVLEELSSGSCSTAV
ncbi:protogenin-like [Acanthaster planci]|uniref:Protogenin-like n=1 Tax=Acanthaster planci TaxID=133434 RepID=A0A8B7ZU95_ACAPL|nr:protogenin-like [Acanthaster planci]